MPTIEIPQLKLAHIALMRDILETRTNRIAWVVPDKDKDSPEDYARYKDTMLLLYDLIGLELLEDITNLDETRPWLEALTDSGRQFRAFAVTKIGIMMMDLEERPTWRN